MTPEGLPFDPQSTQTPESQRQHNLESMPEYEFSRQITQILASLGHETYAIGGFARDLYLGHDPLDLDLATSCPTDLVLETLRQNGITAAKVNAIQAYPIVIARQGQVSIEIATFRQDIYSAGRQTDTVETTSIQADAARRDLTINALYYNLDSPDSLTPLDPTGQGLADLDAKVIRLIGNPVDRLIEDPLRLLRTVRFKNRLGFSYDPATEQALAELTPTILNPENKTAQLSGERRRDELTSILIHPSRVEALNDLDRLGMLDYLVPAFTAGKDVPQSPDHHSEGNVFVHQLLVMNNLPEQISPILAWAALLHDIGKKSTFRQDKTTGKITFYGHDHAGAKLARQEILGQSGFRFSNDQIEAIVWLIDQHMRIRQLPLMGQQKQLEVVKHANFDDLLHLLYADNAASILPDGTTDQDSYEQAKNIQEKFRHLDQIPTITNTFNLDGHFFINRYRISKAHQKLLGPLTNHLNELLQNGTATTANQILTAADQWWEEHYKRSTDGLTA